MTLVVTRLWDLTACPEMCLQLDRRFRSARMNRQLVLKYVYDSAAGPEMCVGLYSKF
jgi:hypothetical protein